MAWETFLNTPSLPDYPSTHSVAGGAASAVLARFFGSDKVAFTMTSGRRSQGSRGHSAAFRRLRRRTRTPGGGPLPLSDFAKRIHPWLASLRRHPLPLGLPGFVYAKPPFGGPKQVRAYLGRYTHRVAIANSRLISVSDGKVRFTWKDYRQDAKTRVSPTSRTAVYGPVRTVVWEGRSRAAPPIPIFDSQQKCGIRPLFDHLVSSTLLELH